MYNVLQIHHMLCPRFVLITARQLSFMFPIYLATSDMSNAATLFLYTALTLQGYAEISWPLSAIRVNARDLFSRVLC